jgi:hypothetical protein
MALILKFEIPNTGVTIDNAYHIVSDVQVIKRPSPVPYYNNPKEDVLKGAAGYYCTIMVQVYASKEARENKSNPVGYLSSASPDSPVNLKFVYDTKIEKGIIDQAYDYLKTTEYYKDAIQD